VEVGTHARDDDGWLYGRRGVIGVDAMEDTVFSTILSDPSEPPVGQTGGGIGVGSGLLKKAIGLQATTGE